MLHIEIASIAKITSVFFCFALIHAYRYPNDLEPIKIITEDNYMRVKLHEPATLSCYVQGSSPSSLKWGFYTSSVELFNFWDLTRITHINDSCIQMTLEFPTVTRFDNGIYKCWVRGYQHWISDRIILTVTEIPRIKIKFAKAIATGSVYLNWTVEEGNDPVKEYSLLYMKNGTEQWQEYWKEVDERKREFIVSELQNNTAYRFGIVATNSIGDSQPAYSEWVTTLEKDPKFSPTAWVVATTLHSITIRWSAPPPELQEYVHYYKIFTRNVETLSGISDVVESTSYIFEHGQPNLSYSIKIKVCSHYTGNCERGPSLRAVTKDRDPIFVPSISTEVTTLQSITVSWSAPPEELRDRVYQYKVMATNQGRTMEPIYLPNTSKSHVFRNLRSYSSYLIKIAACSDYKTQCGNWSIEQEVLTINCSDILKK